MINLGFGFNRPYSSSKVDGEKPELDKYEEESINLIGCYRNYSIIKLHNLRAVCSFSIKKLLTNYGLRSFFLATYSHVLKGLCRFLG
jgi:hypothetical protein